MTRSVINIYKTVKKVGIPPAAMREVAHKALTRAKQPSASLSIHCVGEYRMRTLNRQFRGIEKPTDVLSFGTEEPGSKDVGDIFLCPSYIRRQARRFDVPYTEEFFRMLIHGTLHVCGYDHVKKKDATEMFALQEKILDMCLKETL